MLIFINIININFICNYSYIFSELKNFILHKIYNNSKVNVFSQNIYIFYFKYLLIAIILESFLTTVASKLSLLKLMALS